MSDMTLRHALVVNHYSDDGIPGLTDFGDTRLGRIPKVDMFLG
jgi:hypothetical protein